MVKNYLKMSLRNILRHKGYSIINITGLALGITCCLLVFFWVRYELSFDHFHENAREISLVLTEFHSIEGEINYTNTSQAPLSAILKGRYPEVVNSARVVNFIFGVGKQESSSEEEILCVDPSFLDIFTFPFIHGDPSTALDNPRSVILTETLSRKHFKDGDPLGKTIIVGQDAPFVVTGVIKDIRDNSQFAGKDAIIPMSFASELGWYNLNEWEGFNFITYLQLQKGVFYKDVEQKITDILKNIFPESTTTIQLQPLTRIHLYEPGGGGLIKYIYIFSGMALFILLLACINYMNLSTARSSGRAKEVGVRKVGGANRRQLIRQFLGESLFLSLLATILAVALTYSLIPVFRQLTGREIEISYSIWTFLFIIGIFGLTGLLSGTYPAFILSALKPVSLIKGILGPRKERTIFRKILVVFQFAVSICLIIITLFIIRQMHLIRNKDLGYDKENVICLSSIEGIAQKYMTIRDALLANPNITGMTIVDSFLDSPNSSATSDVVHWEGQVADENIPWLIVKGVDYDFQKTFSIEMSEGRFFSREFPSDLQEGMVINETAVKAMNMDSPVGKRFHFWDFDGTIIGVTKDFNMQSLHKQIEPMVMKLGVNLQRIAIKIKPDNIQATIGFIEDEIKRIVPEYSFRFEFLDQRLNRLYVDEQHMKNITLAISFLAIFISCLGIFGLALYTAEKRTKEIGIRKVFGASISGVFMLLNTEFVKWVIVANIIAWPAAYYFMNRWLENFAYRIELNAGTFILSGLLAISIALISVSALAIKAALINPADSLRYE